MDPDLLELPIMSLLIVVVNYNGLQLTLGCLNSLKGELESLRDVRVALCDNGSAAGEAERLEQEIDAAGWSGWIDFIKLPINLGFTGGNNAAIRSALNRDARPDYFLLLNNDTIVRPGAIASLLHYIEANPEIGVAGSRLEYLDGTPQISAFRFLNWLSEFDRGLQLGLVSRVLKNYLVAQPIPDHVAIVDWVSGASMIIRSEVMHALNGLDDGYYTYFDDIDICRSARNLGWEVAYVPQSRVVHFVAQTTGVERDRLNGKRIPSYYLEARRRYLTKHLSPVHACACDLAYVTGYVVNRARCMVTRKRRVFPRYGLRDQLRESTLIRGFSPPVVRNPALQD